MSSTVTFRIVSLPRELQTERDVAWYISDVLQFGTVASIHILKKTAANGVLFRNAVVKMDQLSIFFPENFILDKVCQLPSFIPEHMNENGNFQFHFDNGKPMTHMKCVIVENTASESNCSEPLETTSWSSIYIPIIPSDLALDRSESDNSFDLQSEEGLKKFFETKLRMGEVSRIDFVSRSLQDSETAVRSAYVHFKLWIDTPFARNVRELIESSGEFRLKGYYDSTEFKRFSKNRFLVFKMNRSPIPEANPEANVHQLAARNKELEERVAELEAKIRQLEEEKNTADMVSDKGPMTMEELMVGHA